MAEPIKSYKLSPQLKAELGSPRHKRSSSNFEFNPDFSGLSKLSQVKIPWKAVGITMVVFVVVISGYIGVKSGYEYLDQKSKVAAAVQQEAYNKHIREVRSEVEVKATDAYSFVELSQRYLKDGDGDRAVAAAEIAAQKDAKWRDGQLNLGQVYLATNQFEKAKTALNKALEIDSTYGQTHYLLSLVYQELRNNDLAKEEFAKAKTFGFEPEKIGG